MMKKYDNIYFIGIGGIGMSAIARYFKARGYTVSGYDKTPSDLTEELENEGIAIHYEDDASKVPSDRENTLVIYTPAIPGDMGELRHVMEHGYKVVKRSGILGEISDGMRCFAIAGTHGKTTTSTLLAHIFTESGAGCSAFLGGISKNYGSNLIIGQNDIMVAEADEFDRSFLRLHPETAVITAMDADHLDIYSDLGQIKEAFRAFASQVSDTLIIKKGLEIDSDCTGADILTYSFDDPSSDFHASEIEKDGCGYPTFTLNYPGGKICGCRVGIPGWINVENAVAAAAAALTAGVAPEKIKESLASFKGVKRRFDIHLNTPKCSYIDDYAHHPKEISSAISSIREMFPGRKLTVIFQPHLYTRTRDFADEFAEALSGADKSVLLDIYPAREKPIPGVTSEIIFRNVTAPEKIMTDREHLLDWLSKEPVDVLVTFGAGNIDRFTEPITEMLGKRI